MLAFALLFLGAGVAVHLEEVEGVSAEAAQAIAESFAKAIHTRTGSVAVVDDTIWECDAEDRCVDAIRARTSTDEVVFLRVFGGPASVRLNAEVVRRIAGGASTAKLSVDRSVPADAEQLSPLAAELFVAGRAPRVVSIVPPDRVVEEPRSIAPWIVLGSSAVVAGAGVAFGVSARNAQAALETTMTGHPEAESQRLESRQAGHGAASYVLISIGVTGAVTALVWMLID